MSAVEELDKAGTAAQTRPTRPNGAPAPIPGHSALQAAPAATDVHVEAVQYRAMWLERRARTAEVTLKWSHSLKAYTKAAHEFKKLRGLASNGALPALHEWAGERALTMVEGAERVRCLLLRQDPPVRPIPPARASGGIREGIREASTSAPAAVSGGAEVVMTLPNISTASAEKDQAGSGGDDEHEETPDLERECCICLESFTRDKLLGALTLSHSPPPNFVRQPFAFDQLSDPLSPPRPLPLKRSALVPCGHRCCCVEDALSVVGERLSSRQSPPNFPLALAFVVP